MPPVGLHPPIFATDAFGNPIKPRVFGEVLTGSIDGVNTAFTVAVEFVAVLETVFFNGMRMQEGAGNDYVRSESGGLGTGYDTVTFAVPPRSRAGAKPDDFVSIDYNPV